jgi:hypothetical protein
MFRYGLFRYVGTTDSYGTKKVRDYKKLTDYELIYFLRIL